MRTRTRCERHWPNTQLLDACKEEADSIKKLYYKLTWTMVDSHAHVVEVEDQSNHAEVEATPHASTNKSKHRLLRAR